MIFFSTKKWMVKR